MEKPLNDDFFTHIILDENGEIDDNETFRQYHTKIAMDYQEEIQSLELDELENVFFNAIEYKVNSCQDSNYLNKLKIRMEMILHKINLITSLTTKQPKP